MSWSRNYGKVADEPQLFKVINMSLAVSEAKNPKSFNAFVKNHPLGTVHQLWEWGEFQAKSANRDQFWALQLEENGSITGTALVIRQRLPFGKNWLYCPRGPLLDYSKKEHVQALFSHIQSLAKKENSLFFRWDPPLTSLEEGKQAITQTQSHPAHAHYQPESTLIVDLTPSEEEILAQMKSKGRYNIKVAQKHGVTITESHDIEAFYSLFKETTSRDDFSGHPLTYYQNMVEATGARLFLAMYENKPIAGAIVTYFNKTATYYYGASSDQNRNVMAPYLLHWHIMQDAKNQGYTEYDLFGIAPENAKNHPWQGVTSFKLKFGGTRINYIDAQEIVYQPLWFWIMKIVKKLRR
ncbi:MAG: peptidoglycan bridge formation glycyltransferase FemA/FemB family protein [Candidatus Gracilibacteria bacterium]